MATSVILRHGTSGVAKVGYYGFSWTTLFFGGFAALFRGDFLTFISQFAVYVIVGFATWPVAPFIILILALVWAFFYNAYYTRRLLERGYQLADGEAANQAAAVALGVSLPTPERKEPVALQVISQHDAPVLPKLRPEQRTLNDDAYKIYLVKKYPAEFNPVLKKHIHQERIYETVDDLMVALDEIERKAFVKHVSERAVGPTSVESAVEALAHVGYEILRKDQGRFEAKKGSSTTYLQDDADLIGFAKALTLANPR